RCAQHARRPGSRRAGGLNRRVAAAQASRGRCMHYRLGQPAARCGSTERVTAPALSLPRRRIGAAVGELGTVAARHPRDQRGERECHPGGRVRARPALLQPQGCLWLPGGLQAARASGVAAPAHAARLLPDHRWHHWRRERRPAIARLPERARPAPAGLRSLPAGGGGSRARRGARGARAPAAGIGCGGTAGAEHPQNRHLIGAAQLALLRDGATFINPSRGALVDHEALIAELRTGRITACLDVTDPEPPPEGSPLYTLPNCILTPHVAGSLGQECLRLGQAVLEEVRRLVGGEPLLNEVTAESLGRLA